MSDTAQPAVAGDILDEYVERYTNWGRWGRDDQCGTANHITRTMVREAARRVERGEVVSIALPFDQNGPQTGANGRFNCLRYSVATGTDHATGGQRWGGAPFPREMGYSDDTVVLHLQSATHWDSLSHIFHKGHMYNGFPATEVTSNGTPHNGSEQLADRLVGRGVLLDVARAKGVQSLDDGYAITADDLEEAAEHARVKLGAGDIILLRTGQMQRCRLDGWGAYAGGDAPGLSFHTIPWLAEREIAAVAGDTWGLEVRPNELPDAFQPFHIPAVVYMGLLLGEMFQLDDLAERCAEDGDYEMFFVAPPLAFTGTAGAPPGPVVIR